MVFSFKASAIPCRRCLRRTPVLQEPDGSFLILPYLGADGKRVELRQGEEHLTI